MRIPCLFVPEKKQDNHYTSNKWNLFNQKVKFQARRCVWKLKHFSSLKIKDGA